MKPVVDDHITKAQVSKPMLNVNPITKPLTSVEGDNDSSNMQWRNIGNELNDRLVKLVVDDHITKSQASKPKLNINPIMMPQILVEVANDSISSDSDVSEKSFFNNSSKLFHNWN